MDSGGLRGTQSRAACRWAKLQTNGTMETSTPGLRMPPSFWMKPFVTPDTSHQTLETRSALAYWQNGKVYMHTGTQSTAQTRPAIARWLNIDAG